MDEKEIKEVQIGRINAFLAHHNANLDTLSKGRQKQFLQIDTAIQGRLHRIASAKEALKTYVINISTIAMDAGISRKTFYNNELLRMFVESYSTDDGKVAPASALSSARNKIADLDHQLQDMLDRDIETGKLWHENESLHNEIKNMRVQISNLQQKYEEVRIENDQLRMRGRSNVIDIGTLRNTDSTTIPMKKRVGTNPDTFNLGISYGTTLDFQGSLDVAAKCGTHTIMLYCDNEYFEVPTEATLKLYNIVIHGPVNINLANPDPRIRKTSVRRILAIIKKCNTFHQYITSFVLHPGSADDISCLIESLKEILAESKFKIAIETMAGRGKELCSNLNQISTLCNSLCGYSNFSICLDTCHMSDAGYDLTDVNGFIKQLLLAIPIEKISCIHINDSMNEVGLHKDRHTKIGTGKIPLKSLAQIVTCEEFFKVPKIIETPQNCEEGKLTFAEEMKSLLNKPK